jgi:hypothetical protein
MRPTITPCRSLAFYALRILYSTPEIGDHTVPSYNDCTIRDEWFIKWSLELRAKMIIIKMFKVQEE